MNSISKCVAVVGATGHTGQFVVHEALRRGLSVVAVGRSAARLDETIPEAVPRRVAELDDPVRLEQAFAGCAVVINCAGPFLDTAAPVAQAALRAGCHYIDVTAEQPSAQASFTELDAPARAAGKVVIPAAAFYGGLADLLASALAGDGEIDEITVAIALDRWWPTAGTRKTGERNTVPRLVVKNGHLAPFVPSAEVPDWVFSAPLGQQAMVEIPFSEVITLAHHLKVGEIRSLINRSALADIRDASTPQPTAADESGRSAQRFELVVRLIQGGLTRTAGVRGQDIYAVTAPIVVEAALRLLAPSYRRSGALSLAQAVDPVELLRALHGPALDLFGDALPG
ncbi:saccharopine dehydrogenase NADP-binding domain-containing protein [Hydrogenophaga taeniospiralis]|uniref:saccharopine dehydrogenase family protein n=1 Tax=Hydrogenophaga taeniospiralis TaxID=65656 RepID=UPI001CFABC99|nr:saccharopine dehydrogenase NADP-binding domain-containing protein [Hydrogenophaga taeniospiralis]MCB4366049.1 saccharopine dehydrogenase NADP-binding domain-containing protein [Hydrogenophaga taeniospiralis]